jgi:hypothetical protein
MGWDVVFGCRNRGGGRAWVGLEALVVLSDRWVTGLAEGPLGVGWGV